MQQEKGKEKARLLGGKSSLLQNRGVDNLLVRQIE